MTDEAWDALDDENVHREWLESATEKLLKLLTMAEEQSNHQATSNAQDKGHSTPVMLVDVEKPRGIKTSKFE